MNQSDRLIPARAGKTGQTRRKTSHATAHPRAGGENITTSNAKLHVVGSSPRGRGKRRDAAGEEFADRLIPARAGKTGSPTPRRASRTAHPRAGGENVYAAYG